jgi:hypothetical protein
MIQAKQKIIKAGSMLLVLLSSITLSSCFLVDNNNQVIIPKEGFTYSCSKHQNNACQIGIKRHRTSDGNNSYTLWQCVKGDGVMSINKRDIVDRYKGNVSPVKALRIPETSKFKKWWKKYWMRENKDWRKVKRHDFTDDAFLKIDFESNAGLGDTLLIIERDFPQSGDSVVISVKLPDTLSIDDYFRSTNLDAGLQLYRLKQDIDKDN